MTVKRIIAIVAVQFVGMLAIVQIVGTAPTWRLIISAIGMAVLSVALVDLNYRIGGDSRYPCEASE